MQYIAKGLEELLEYWEYTNKDAEKNFANLQYCKNNGFYEKRWSTTKGIMEGKDIVEIFFQSPEVGSEVTSEGRMRRNLANYQNLRRLLKGDYDGPVEEFLPRVPKRLRHLYPTQTSFLQKLHDSNFHIGYYLWQWNQTRRGIVIDDKDVKVPIMDLRDENWLTKTPYPTFYLNAQQTFVLDYGGFDLNLEHFLIHDTGEEVGILVWSNDPTMYYLSPELLERDQKITDAFLTHKNIDISKFAESSDAESIAFAPCTFHIKINKRTLACKMYELKSIDVPVQEWIYIYDEAVRKDDPYRGFFVKVVEYINGVYKTMASLPPQTKNEVTIISTNAVPAKKQEPCDWFALPLQCVDQVIVEKHGKKIVYRHASGGEKEPHFRRGHWRRYISKDGSVNEVWIELMIVREDKLEAQIAGGATKVR